MRSGRILRTSNSTWWKFMNFLVHFFVADVQVESSQLDHSIWTDLDICTWARYHAFLKGDCGKALFAVLAAFGPSPSYGRSSHRQLASVAQVQPLPASRILHLGTSTSILWDIGDTLVTHWIFGTSGVRTSVHFSSTSKKTSNVLRWFSMYWWPMAHNGPMRWAHVGLAFQCAKSFQVS